MEKRLIFVTGGCRSGKSHFALDYANRHFSKKLYLATCEVLDEEMALRVADHKKLRGPEWKTIEEPINVVGKISQYEGKVEVILLDCMTLWLSNLLLKVNEDLKVIDEVNRLVNSVKQGQISMILVSNEVGMGIVPSEPLGRRFRDFLGIANQRIADVADKVIFMISGIPIFLKGKE
jgi:adenosylcobinamide kinase/adenosylcobinamide-phosphate guanylyltransferase